MDTSVVGHAEAPCEKGNWENSHRSPHFTSTIFSPFLWVSHVSQGTIKAVKQKRIWKKIMTTWQAEAVAPPTKGFSLLRKPGSYPMSQGHSPHKQGTITVTGMAAEWLKADLDWAKCKRLRHMWEPLLNAASSQGGGNPSCSFFQLFLKELQGQWRLLEQISPARDILPRGKRIVLLTDPKPWRKILPQDVLKPRGKFWVGKVTCSSFF